MKHFSPSPAIVLFFTAPIFGELFSGSTPLNEFVEPIALTTLCLLYGCGAILCRELVVRWNQGMASLILLGLAYGIYEEGLLVQSFFDPTWQDLGPLAIYGRRAGVNWVWTEHLLIYHALISILASVTFVEAFYPDHRHERWIKTPALWYMNWIGFAGVYLFWELLTSYDPGRWRWISWLCILGLGLAAWKLPHRQRVSCATCRPAGPWRFLLLGFVALFAQFLIVYIGADHGHYPYPLAMLMLVLEYALVCWLVRCWSGHGQSWDDRHRLALVIGALSFFLIGGLLSIGKQHPVVYWTHPIYELSLILAYRHIRHRVLRPSMASA